MTITDVFFVLCTPAIVFCYLLLNVFLSYVFSHGPFFSRFGSKFLIHLREKYRNGTYVSGRAGEHLLIDAYFDIDCDFLYAVKA